MPRISIVVPIYNVEPYLRQCLDSLVGQSFEDFEVIVVDDGSTDGSRAIAEEYAARDARFRILTQPNGGLGSARNTGADAATGEFLAFVDSDDVVPRHAYKLLAGSLEETGSDFATGNVHRLTTVGTAQSPFLADTFVRSQQKTHVTRFRPLLADRIVPNKLWRRSFWVEQGYRFPEGMLHEDIPVVVPAQFAARSVDIIAEPVYHYRIREGGELSITQRRAELRALSDRMTAIERVSEHLREHAPRRAKRWYDESVVADDLSYYVNVLDSADDEYRAVFLDRVNAFLDRASRRTFDKLPAIQRLQWHLIRRRLMPELLEVLRFQREDIRTTPPVRIRGRWYGDYPFLGDSRLRVPRSVYKLDEELWMEARLDGMRRSGDSLELRGWAYVNGIGAPAKDGHRAQLVAVRRGRGQRIRQRFLYIPLKTVPEERPDATGKSRQPLADVRWSGFMATLDARKLRRLGRWREGTWELYVVIRAGREKRRTTRFTPEAHVPIQAIELDAGDADVSVKAAPAPRGKVTLEVRRRWATVSSARIDGDALVVSGEARLDGGPPPAIEAVRRSDARAVRFPMTLDGARFEGRVPIADLAAAEAPASDDEEPTIWDLVTVAGPRREALGLAAGAGGPAWPHGDGELALFRTRRAEAALIERLPGIVATEAHWTGDGELELAGDLPERFAPSAEIVLSARDHVERYAFPLRADLAARRFTARLSPARLPSLAGALPLRAGPWDLQTRPAGAGSDLLAPVRLGEALLERLPAETVVDHKPFALGAARADTAMLAVQSDLDDDEHGPYNQRLLQTTRYRPGRAEPLRDAVVYSSFGGRQFSDSPRAIHAELARRGAPLDHLWVIRDAACEVPEGVTAVREGSREHYDALARSRYVVANDHFPRWFERRADQTCLQTWHGTPLKRLGLDVSATRKTVRKFQHRWDQQVANWQYVLSPNAFTTPILRRAYAVEGEMLETGYPRNDVLAAAGRDERTRELRRQLGLPEGVRTVLYAPTYRDSVIDRRGRYRLDLQLDLDLLREAVGDDTVILFRKHHYVADEVPAGANGFVRDVSRYPDGTELMLAADVLLTDYSSMMFDYANTGRPMLFFTYDLDAYQDVIRGFYLDFEATVPGPMMKTTAEVAEALRDIDGVRAAHAQRYEEFAARFCELDDGRAAARVVDRVFDL